LIWDLEHPKRFYLIFTRPQWRSWLVRGAFIIAGYSLVLLIHFVASLMGHTSWQRWLMIPGIPLAGFTAVYTAYLFAQAKARDMWQNPLLPPHLLVQSLLLGSAVFLLMVLFLPPTNSDTLSGMIDTREGVFPLMAILAVTSLLHLLMVAGEISLVHPTAHARLAVWEMVQNRFRNDFWIGTGLSILGGVLAWLPLLEVVDPWVGIGAAPLALIGLMLYENAYVQAGQSVPLA
jgi:formate-dependent nitrite reductase membrane component NrfD